MAEARGRCLVLAAAGAVAVAALLATPFEQLRPAGFPIDGIAFRALSLVNPALFTAIGIALGCWLAPKVGLDAPLAAAIARREPPGPVLRRQLGPATAVGLAVALILLGYGWLTRDAFTGATAAASFQPALLTKLLYGGIGEELLMRWGVMTLFVWLAWRLGGSRRPVSAAAFGIGAVCAAALFAAGHLPLLFTLLPDPPALLIAAVLAGNAIPGLLFGWLYWRRGLEAAIIAHMLAHAIASLAAPLTS